MKSWKALLFTLCAVCTLATFVPRADAQISITVGHRHHHRHHHRHVYYRHGHRYYR